MRQSSFPSIALHIILLILLYTGFQFMFSETGYLAYTQQEMLSSSADERLAAEQERVEQLYSQSREVTSHKFMSSVMQNIGYGKEGEKFYIFSREESGTLSEEALPPELPSSPSASLAWLGRPLISFLVSLSIVISGSFMIRKLRDRKKRGKYHG